jgi:hypothetical protein
VRDACTLEVCRGDRHGRDQTFGEGIPELHVSSALRLGRTLVASMSRLVSLSSSSVRSPLAAGTPVTSEPGGYLARKSGWRRRSAGIEFRTRCRALVAAWHQLALAGEGLTGGHTTCSGSVTIAVDGQCGVGPSLTPLTYGDLRSPLERPLYLTPWWNRLGQISVATTSLAICVIRTLGLGLACRL